MSNKSKDIDPAVLKQIFDELDTLSGDALRRRYAEFAKQHPGVLMGGKPADEIDPEDTEDPIPPMEVPSEGRVKNWGGNPDPNTWDVTDTKDKKWGNFKVVDDKGKNIADGFSTKENAIYFIEYYQKTNTTPTDNDGTKPDVPDTGTDGTDDGDKPTPSIGFPIPTGFVTSGKVSTAFKHWGRHTTNYASGGSGPSERWDNTEIQDYDIVSGYEFNLGTLHGKRGSDNIDLKSNADGHNDKNGGWYIPYIEWEEDGTDGGAGVGKEYPHPKTSHMDFNVQGKGIKVKNIKDGQWHAMLTAKFKDSKGTPTVHLWYNEKATGKFADYILLGISKDTGNMSPGPVCDEIGKKGKKEQSLQIRMDEVPDAQIRNAFAVAAKPPANA